MKKDFCYANNHIWLFANKNLFNYMDYQKHFKELITVIA